MNILKTLIGGGLLLGILTVTELTIAQSSVATYGGSNGSSLYIGGSHITTEETLYLGRGSYEINGIWEVYSKNIVIDPNAVISGTGSIQIYNPSDMGKTPSQTFIDGNAIATAIEVNIVLNNASGMVLKNIDFPSELAGTGFTNNTVSSTYIGKDLNLAVDGADVWLGTINVGDLRFDNNASISNASANRMIITNNSILSHVVRDAGSTGFFFPIGIADGDYTPATIAGANQYNVSVQNYGAAAPTIANISEGMDRVWHVFGGTASSVALHHNQATNGSTFSDPNAFITRYQGAGAWSIGVAEQTSLGVHTNTSAIGTGIPAGSADASYLTKASNPTNPLPVTLLNFDVYKVENTSKLEWITVKEISNTGFDIEKSLDGKSWSNIGFVKSLAENGNRNAQLVYSFTDKKTNNGTNYYRLKQTNFDGNFDYSDVRSVIFDIENSIEIYPNPVNNVLNIKGLSGNETIALVDATGRAIKQAKSDVSTLQLDMSNLASGVYYLNILHANGTLQTEKIVKSH